MAGNAKAGRQSGEQWGIKPWVLFVPVFLIGLVFLPSSVVIGAGMLPTVVARVVDSSLGKRLSITVGCFNFIGCLYFLDSIWAAGQGMGDIRPTLSDSLGWLSALTGAGVGWTVFGGMPIIFAKIAEAQTALRLHSIGKDQDRLVEDWGEPVRGVYGLKTVEKADAEG